MYSTLYALTRKILWLIDDWYNAPGSIEIVRTLGTAVAALPLAIDTRSRYGDALRRLLGTWARCLFKLITATSCMILGVVSAILMCLAAQQFGVRWYLVLLYVILALTWMWLGMCCMIPHDETRSANTLSRFLTGLAVGCVGGCFRPLDACFELPGCRLGGIPQVRFHLDSEKAGSPCPLITMRERCGLATLLCERLPGKPASNTRHARKRTPEEHTGVRRKGGHTSTDVSTYSAARLRW